MTSVPNGTDTIKHQRYKCLVEGCNASYNRPIRLEVHTRKHTAERPFRCDIPGCSLSYTNIAHLKRHKCLVHEKSGEVMCEEEGCLQVFSNKYSLKKHVNNKHKTIENVFKCSECSLSFKRKQQLHQHAIIHTEDGCFKCSICNIGFTKLHLYNKHNRNHKTYTCDCGSAFDRWTQFCEHRRISCTIKRIDHKCIICNRTFTTNTNLKQHSLTHLRESQLEIHRCSYINCTRSYKYKKNLNAHIATFHEKSIKTVSFPCAEPGCGQVLKSKKNLKQHILSFHSGLPKKIKKRRPRKDKGTSKKCMASIMSGIELPFKDHKALLTSSTAHKSSSEESALEEQTDIEEDSIKSHINQRYQQNNDQIEVSEGENNDNSSVNNHVDDNIKPNCTNVSIELTSEEHMSKTEQCTENSRVVDIEQNVHSPDDILLDYCDDVLKALQDNLDKIPNMTSNLVY